MFSRSARIEFSFGAKRFVLRYPERPSDWNGRLLLAAHGGSGGESYSRDGRMTGTDETSLDDVVGVHALAHGFAYASVDRDGTFAAREELALIHAFAELMESRVASRMGRAVEKTYLSGLSMGGGIARFAAEEDPPRFDGVLIIVGAGGDAPSRGERALTEAQSLLP